MKILKVRLSQRKVRAAARKEAYMKLFESWTFSLPLPEPAKKLAEAEGTKMSVDEKRCSMYNDKKAAKKATLHGPTLRALNGLDQVLNDAKGALGIQMDSAGHVLHYFMECDRYGGRYGLMYNPANGEMLQIENPSAGAIVPDTVGQGSGDGKYLLLMMAFASLLIQGVIYDDEFERWFSVYCSHRGVADAEFLNAAYICCDNLYRRMMALKIPCSRQIQDDGVVGRIEESDLDLYRPNQTVCGEFRIFKPEACQDGEANVTGFKTVGDVMKTYCRGLPLTEEERERIPDIPEHYLVSKDAENILRKITRTNMRVFMLRGEAGTGKTTTVQIIAKCLGLPYYYFCCGEGTEETDLISSYLPNTGKPEQEETVDADWMDFMMDPAGVLCGLTGMYEEGLDMQTAFSRLLQEVYAKGQKAAEDRKDFILVESDLIKGCRRPSVVEIQEPTVIGRPGTLVKLNSLLDGCSAVTLSNGEVVQRHPDTVIILTTNTAYNGCRPMNQSVLSRLNLLIDEDSLTAQDMVKRAMARTGCTDEGKLLSMAEMMLELKKNFSDVIAIGGICGYREYEDWVSAWSESGDMLAELRSAVISKMTDQTETQQEILSYAKTMKKMERVAA